MTVYEVAGSQQHRQQQELLTVRRWVLIVLVLCLLLTVSLLLGITMQHFQLLNRLTPHVAKYKEEENNNGTEKSHGVLALNHL